MHRTLAHTDGWRFFAMHCAVGAYQRGMVLSMGDVDGWQEVFMQNYSCGDCFEVMAFRYFPMIYLSIKCFYEKMLEKLVFCY